MVLSASLAARADAVSDIEVVNSALAKYFNVGEISAMAGMYTDDAVMLPPSSEILSSPATITSYWNQLRQVGVNKYSVYLVDLKLEGDVAYTTSLWEASRAAGSDGVITMTGNISNVLEKQKDGSWKIKLQSWN